MRGVHPFALLAAALVSAGCTSATQTLAPAGTDDPLSSNIVEPEPGVKIAENRGALRGFLRDEGNLTVGQGRISLLGTDHFQDVNGRGEFLFLNITAGEYEINAQSEGYAPLTQKAAIVAGKATTVYLFLAPALEGDLGDRFHLHDFWGERSEVTIMDAKVDLTTARSNGGSFYSGAYASLYLANQNSSERLKFWIQDAGGEDPPIVFPGTKELVVTMSWTQQEATFKRLGLAYNASGGASNQRTPRYLPLQASGSSWVIPVGPGMADDGHRTFSKWWFWVHSPAASAATAGPDGPPGAILAPIQIKMVIRKGEVQPEPAHPDFWQGKTAVPVIQKTVSITQVSTAGSSNRESGSYHIDITEPGKLVPPGTTRLRIAFWWKYEGSTAAGPLANGSAADRDYVLTWLTPDQHPAYTKLTEYGRAAPVYEDVAGHVKVYEVKLKPEETDRFYDRYTGWKFLPSVKGDENDPEFRETRGRAFTIAVTAYRDPDAT
ncbi:MAG: carboxypeptidase regulatory-like domain-containing protein [Euryarchaeota archaeon]|nr:carboxypeptidase regulatory-like domain-containing protein [Euryarchaeota archaeon]